MKFPASALLLIAAASPSSAFAETRYFIVTLKGTTISQTLYDLNLSPIYGKRYMLRKTLELNPRIRARDADGMKLYEGEPVYLPIQDVSQLPAHARVLPTGEIVLGEKVAGATGSEPVHAPEPILSPIPSPNAGSIPVLAPLPRGNRRQFWAQLGFGQITTREQIGIYETRLNSAILFPELSGGATFEVDRKWSVSARATVSHVSNVSDVSFPLFYSLETAGLRENAVRFSDHASDAVGLVVRMEKKAHATPDLGTSITLSSPSTSRDTTALEAGVRNCVRMDPEIAGRSLCLDFLRIFSLSSAESARLLPMKSLSGWKFNAVFVQPLDANRRFHAVAEGSYGTMSSGANSVLDYRYQLGLRATFY